MSVLVEALTLVVRRTSLELAFPGGAEAFLSQASELPHPPRFACNDDPHLVNVSFEEPAHAYAAIRLLEANGLVELCEDGAEDFVKVDQCDGPSLPCTWLEWERFTDAVTVAWVAGAEPGELAAPEGWEPAAQPESEDDVDVDDAEDAPELWTGTDAEDAMPLHAAVMTALADAGWTTYLATPPAVMVDLRGEHALYTCRWFCSQPLDAIVCYTRLPLIVPQPARCDAMEFITRANYGLMMGSFELSLDEGHLFFRATCPVQDGVVTTPMVCELANVGVWAFDRYMPKLLEVVYGSSSAADAVKAAES